MMGTKKKPKPNPHCPVAGCRAKSPHATDPTVLDFIKVFGPPAYLTASARTAMLQLLISMQQDWEGKRHFAWFCRIRQTQELFYKTLYLVLFASEKEAHHIMCGEYPSSFVPYYEKVNDELYAGRGELTEQLPGLPPGSTIDTTLDLLHSGAHTSVAALMSALVFQTKPEYEPLADKLHFNIRMYVDRLAWMHMLFADGATKDVVLEKYKQDRNWREELARLKPAPNRA